MAALLTRVLHAWAHTQSGLQQRSALNQAHVWLSIDGETHGHWGFLLVPSACLPGRCQNAPAVPAPR